MSKLTLKIPPVAQGIIALAFIWLLSQYLPILLIDIAFKGTVSAVIICIGFLVGAMAVAAFVKLRTTVDPRYPEKASKLVVIGIYRYSRNPMYLAIVMVLFGISVYLGALSSFLILMLFVAYINRYQIVPEEQILEKKFGERYSKYTKNVRRWI
jgi:protein-S-isoprenylcysteine O-methyltransferase Ste14